MGLTVLLDSVIIIDQLNGILRAESFLEEVQEDAAVSVITRAEVLVGYPDEEWPIAESVLDSFPLLEIDSAVADAAARLRRDQRRLKLPDALQAALAQHNGLRLATRNTRDFSPDQYPFVIVPYTV